MIPVKQLERLCQITEGDTIPISRKLAEDLVVSLSGGDDPDKPVRDLLLNGRYLTSIERALLVKMQLANGYPVESKQLLSCSRAASLESLWVHIHRLRNKLDTRKAVIQAVHGIGYQLEVKTK